MPAISPLTFVLMAAGLAMVDVFGPETCVHEYDEIVPVASLAEPVNVTVLIGKVMVCAVPAETTGGWFGAGLTVMVTVESAGEVPACRCL